MNEIKLRHVIEILYDMELNNYCTERAIRRLEYEINNLARPRNIAAPVRRKVDIDAETLGGVLGGVLC